MYISIYTLSTCTYTYIYLYMYMYIHVYNIHIHIYIYIYIYIYISIRLFRRGSPEYPRLRGSLGWPFPPWPCLGSAFPGLALRLAFPGVPIGPPRRIGRLSMASPRPSWPSQACLLAPPGVPFGTTKRAQRPPRPLPRISLKY